VSSEPQGEYLAFVDVSVEHEQGHRLLDTTSKGPWLFADLPSGTYRVTAETPEGSPIVRTVTVGSRPTEVHFTWG
jgi:hypothetical protein